MEKNTPVHFYLPAGLLILILVQLACLAGGATATPSSAVATIVALTTTPGSSLPTLTVPPTITRTATPTSRAGVPTSVPLQATPTPTLDPNLVIGTPLAVEGERLPETAGLITHENHAGLVEILRLGSGRNARASFSGDGLLLGIISDIGTSLYDSITLAPVPITPENVERFKLPKAGELGATRLSDGIYLVDLIDDELQVQLEEASTLEMAFTRDWSLAAGRLSEGVAGIWDTQSGDLIRRLDTNTSEVFCSRLRNVTISPEGRYVASGCEENGNAYLWRVQDGVLLHTLITKKRTLSGLSFSNQGTFIAAVMPGNQVAMWRVRTGELLRILADARGTLMMEGGSLLYSPDGYYMLGVFPSGEVLAWRVSDGGLLRRMSGPGFHALQPSEGLGVDQNGNRIFWSDWTGINTYDLEEGKPSFTLAAPASGITANETSTAPVTVSTGFLKSMAVSGDGRALTLIFDSENQMVTAFRTADGTKLSEFACPDPPQMIRQSPAGNVAAVASMSGIYLLHPTRLEPIGFLEPQAAFEMIDSAAFSPDGRLLATGHQNTGLSIWNWELKEILTRFPDLSALSLAFSPGGAYLAVGSEGEVHLMDTTTWQEVGSVLADGLPLTFSNDGSLLVVTNLRGEILVYTTDTLQELIRLVGHARPISSLLFSPRGHWLASASEDGTVRLWGIPAQP